VNHPTLCPGLLLARQSVLVADDFEVWPFHYKADIVVNGPSVQNIENGSFVVRLDVRNKGDFVHGESGRKSGEHGSGDLWLPNYNVQIMHTITTATGACAFTRRRRAGRIGVLSVACRVFFLA
jgi:hypothetical protein